MIARKLTVATLVALCALGAILTLSAAPALAAAPSPLTFFVGTKTATTAIFQGVPDFNAGAVPVESGVYEFLYKATTTVSIAECESPGASKAPVPPGTYLGAEEFEIVEQAVTGLTPDTEYIVCLLAENGKGEKGVGEAVQFVTAPQAPETREATEVKATSARLEGVLKPLGAKREYRFTYNQGASCTGGSATPFAEGEGAVSAVVQGLTPGVKYTFCLVARNVDGETAGGGKSFETPPGPPAVDEEFTLNVSATSATLNATINPDGLASTYRFEYGTGPSYGTSVPIPDGLLGAGSVTVSVSVHLQNLLSSSEYHYRVVASNESSAIPVDGADRVFMTQPPGSQPVLADGRQWELVTPPNKYGAGIEPLSVTGPLQAAEDGGGIVYQTNVPPELEPAGYGQGNFFNQVLSRRGPQGWSTRNIAIPHRYPVTAPRTTEYSFFSRDLSLGMAEPLEETPTPLSSEASEATRYIRREALCDAPATASECYLPLLTGKEGFADVPPGTKFGEGHYFNRVGETEFEGATPDLSRALMYSHVALTATPIAGEGELYEWSAGMPADETLQLVSVLPASEGGGPASGAPINVGSNLAQAESGARHSISNDGSRIFWGSEIAGGDYTLYMRDTVKRETVRLDVPQSAGLNNEKPHAIFQIASSDGSRVFFTDGQTFEPPVARLTPQSGKEGQDLYECEIVEEAGKLVCKLADLTPETGGQSAEVQNQVVGASEDGSYLYFVANGVLGDGAEHGAKRGTCTYSSEADETCNLYEYHDGKIAFIATLSHEDEFAWGRGEGEAFIAHAIGFQTARVSPDGRFVAFMSDRSLTGYDNLDANSGKPDMEVYLYDAASGHLACASCNPTGSRPVGVEVREFEHFEARTRTHEQNVADISSRGGTFSLKSWVAANLVGGDEVGPGQSTALYQSRSLSDGGRLFFNSEDPLVAQAVNGNEDVYEFEPEGMGSCTASTVTFDDKTGGCVFLISSGISPEESGFMDASEDGKDVFFMTAAKLVPQDHDNAYDIYDAHLCTTVAPCASAPVFPPPCNSGESCKAAPSPQPPIFGSPSSATFTGKGNVISSPSPGPVVKPRSLTRAQKLARALRVCRSKPKRARAGCKRQARKRYGAKAARAAAAARATSGSRG